MSEECADSQPLDPQRAANLAENPHAGQGMVMLDIGDDVGAIVLHLPAALEGAEVEIEPADDPGDGRGSPALALTHDHPHPHLPAHDHLHRPHVAVVGRPVGDRVDHSAVFPSLTEGRYDLYVPGASAPLRLEVHGGRVTEAAWPGEQNPS